MAVTSEMGELIRRHQIIALGTETEQKKTAGWKKRRVASARAV
jgi:hypothetical protein